MSEVNECEFYYKGGWCRRQPEVTLGGAMNNGILCEKHPLCQFRKLQQAEYKLAIAKNAISKALEVRIEYKQCTFNDLKFMQELGEILALAKSQLEVE